VYGVALETASELELCVLPEAMKVWANSKEPEGVSDGGWIMFWGLAVLGFMGQPSRCDG
jgi:hypothetical protein